MVNEGQTELLNNLSDAMKLALEAGLTVRGDGQTQGLIVMRQDILEKMLKDEEIPEMIDYTDDQKTTSDKLHQTILACSDADLVFHCDPKGMYAMDKVFYDQFVSDHPENCSEDEWNDFQAHIVTVEDHGAYYKGNEKTCDCSSCHNCSGE